MHQFLNVSLKAKIDSSGGRHSSSVDRAQDSWSGGREFDPIPALYWFGLCQYSVTDLHRIMVSPLCLCMATRKIVRHQSWNPFRR